LARWMRLAFGLALAALAACVAAADEEVAADRATAPEAEADEASDLVEYVDVEDSSLPKSNTIATKLPVPLERTPALVGTVGDALIYEQGATSLSDALENVSGLDIQNGSGVHEFFSIRGFDSISSGLVMIDGVAEPEVSVYNTYNVRGVEVFKGPAGFLYGKNPLSGAVNIVRKQPLLGDFLAVNGSAGSFGTEQGTLDWNHSAAADQVAFRVNGLWRESDHYRDDKESRHAAVNPSLALELGPKSRVVLNYEYVDAEYSPDNGVPLVGLDIPSVSRKRSYQERSDFSDQTLDRFQADYETALGERVTLRDKLYYRDQDWESDGTLLQATVPASVFTPWLAPGEVQVVRDLATLDDKQQFVGNQLEAVVRLQGGAVEHSLLFGLEYVHENDEFAFDLVSSQDVELRSGSPTAFDLGGCPAGQPPPCFSPSVGDVTNEVIAPYVVDRMQLSPKFDLMLGVRYDHIEVTGDSSPLGAPSQRLDRDDSKTSPMAGIVFAPRETLSLYANAAQSYSPPSTRLVDATDANDREPERGRQLELGVKQKLAGGRVRTALAVYQQERDRIPIADANGFTQQAGDQRSRGAELEVAAELRPRLRTIFTYAYNDAELTDFARFDFNSLMTQDLSGNTPIMAPRHVADLWVSKSFENGFGLAGGGRWVDEEFVAEDNQFAIDSYFVADAAVFYELDAWRFRLNLKNITDEEYEMRGIAGGASVIPADPFAAYASVEYRFR